MGMSLNEPDQRSQTPPAQQTGLMVNLTPGGSCRPTGKAIPIAKTPSGHVRVLPEPTAEPLCANVLERVEALDMEEKEVEDMLQQQPWHVKRWLRDQHFEGRQECVPPDPPSFAEASGSGIASVCTAKPSNIETIPGVASANVARPSTSECSSLDPPHSAAGVCAAKPSNTKTIFRISSSENARPSSSKTNRPLGKALGVLASRFIPNAASELDSEFDDEFDEPVVESNLGGLGRDIPDDEDLEEPVRNIIGAVEAAMDDENNLLLGVSTTYDWQEDFESFRGVPEIFSGPTPGPVKDYDTPYEAFADIWSMDFIERIAEETNRYAKQTIDSMKAAETLKPSSRLHKWVDTDADEIMVLFTVFMYMALDPRTSQYEYWKSDDYLEMPKFRLLMTYNRYILLSKFLHFVDNSDASQNSLQSGGVELSPKLAKIAPVISHLSTKFASLYNLQGEIAIDESLALFKGRLSWVQRINTKAARFGIKSYELCESQTGYLWRFQIYTGKKDTHNTHDGEVAASADLGGKTTKIVIDLLKDLHRRGYFLTMDNFYNSAALARYVKSLGFDCLGTLRPNRRNVPKEIAKFSKRLQRGTIIARNNGDVSVLAWKDKKQVTMISTYHSDETFVGSKGNKEQVKPVSVRDYNKSMGGVDLKDQKLSMYLLERKRGLKWYMKIFKRLLNTSIHNALIMHVKSLQRRDKLPMTHREFRYPLAKSIADKHRRGGPVPIATAPLPELVRLRRDILHSPRNLPSSKRRNCAVSSSKGIRKGVSTQCVTCDEYICFDNCWDEWHTSTTLKEKYTRGRKRQRIQ